MEPLVASSPLCFARLLRCKGTACGALPSARKYFARANRPLRRNALLMQFFSTDRIAQRHRIVENLQDGDIRFTTDFEATDSILPTDNTGRVYRTVGDDLFEAQTQWQELGQHRR